MKRKKKWGEKIILKKCLAEYFMTYNRVHERGGERDNNK